MTADVVAPEVLAAFGLTGSPVVLEGGQGSSVRVDDVVLKPGSDETSVAWVAGLVDRVVPRGFRLPRPVRARDGRWTVDGWSATEHVAGEAEPDGRWQDVLATSRAFHAAVADEPRPPLLDGRDDRWAVADRVAWGESDTVVGPGSTPLLALLRSLRRPVDLTAQLVHGDLSGNVLLAPALPPAVIDLSPYWRPAPYADAVVVVDALLWWDAEVGLPDDSRPPALSEADWHQLLVRAAVFRLVSLDELARTDEPEMAEQLALYERVVDLLVRRSHR